MSLKCYKYVIQRLFWLDSCRGAVVNKVSGSSCGGCDIDNIPLLKYAISLFDYSLLIKKI